MAKPDYPGRAQTPVWSVHLSRFGGNALNSLFERMTVYHALKIRVIAHFSVVVCLMFFQSTAATSRVRTCSCGEIAASRVVDVHRFQVVRDLPDIRHPADHRRFTFFPEGETAVWR